MVTHRHNGSVERILIRKIHHHHHFVAPGAKAARVAELRFAPLLSPSANVECLRD